MITGQVATVVTGGVSQGDVFKYSVVYVWTSTDANATPPAYWVEANSTEYNQATVKEVTGTTITLQTIQHFLNGTDINQTELADVGSGITGSVLLYAANLANGSYLFPSSTSMPWVINATVSRAYGAATETQI